MMKEFSWDNLKQTFALMINAIKNESSNITIDYDTDEKNLIVNTTGDITFSYDENTKTLTMYR